ncbi:MAG: PPOX class F420-dependent oxidoreductase [Myxococcales bacterium]|nr:PPOX class F420-dependent oxidoreductase [Myxococcales bacterium]
MAQMDRPQVDDFLAATRIAKLVTLNADGSPNVVPVWFEWDGAEALVFTTRTSAKVRRIRRDPRVALSVEEGVGVPEAWVSIEGTATVESAGAWSLIERLTPRYYDAVKARETLLSWGQMKDEWVVIRVEPARIRSSAPEG